MSDPERIGLAEAIGQVRAELESARLRGESQELQFRLDKVTLEFAVELQRAGSVEAGVKIWVVSVGAKGEVSSTHTNKVTVSMVPQVKSENGWADAVVSADATARRPPLPGSSSGAGVG